MNDLAVAWLQNAGRGLEQPRKQQNEKQPHIVPAQAPCHRFPVRHRKARKPQVLPHLIHPVNRVDRVARRKYPRVVVALDQSHASAIDMEEPIAARLDVQHQEDQHHRKQQHAVMRLRRRKRDRQHRSDTGYRPVRRAIEPIAPAHHSGQLASVVVRERIDELDRVGRKDRRPLLCGIGPNGYVFFGDHNGLAWDATFRSRLAVHRHRSRKRDHITLRSFG